MAALTAFMTAFYMWRLIFLAMFGEENPANHPKESPPSMTFSLVVLALLATVGGLVGTPWKPVWGEWIYFLHPHHLEPNYMIMLGSVVLALAGIYLAYNLYVADKTRAGARAMAEKYRLAYTLSYNKFYIDEIYLWFNHAIIDGSARLFYLFDIYVVDGIIVNGIAAFTRLSGEGLRVSQTGRLQNYALVFFLGVLALAVVLAFIDPSVAAGLTGGVK
jgi:NADH-quinone oxidoreductase subunit L